MSPRYVVRQLSTRTRAMAGASPGCARRIEIASLIGSPCDALRRRDHVLDGEAEELEERRGGRGFAEPVDADDGGAAVVHRSDVLVPAAGRRGLHDDARDA